MPQETIYTVRGGTTVENDPSRYPANVRYYDTLSQIALEIKQNNNDPRPLRAIMLEIARDNNLPGPRPGVDCNERNIMDVRIRAGQELRLRTDQPLDFEPHYECPPERRAPAPQPAEPLENVTRLRTRVTPQPSPEPEARARLPRYPNGGNLGSGTTAEVYDAQQAYWLAGRIRPNQPNVAARGINNAEGSVQTVVGTTGAIAERAAMGIISAVPLGPVSIIPTGLTLNVGTPQDRVGPGRQGSGAMYNQEDGGRNGRIDLPIVGGLLRGDDFFLNPFGTTRTTRMDATLLPGRGIQFNEQGRVVDVPGENRMFDNNNWIGYASRDGEAPPVWTTSETAERSRGINQNRTFLQATPSTLQEMRGMNDYTTAYLMSQRNLEPQISEALTEFHANPTADGANRLIGLYNYRQNMVGFSNYDVRRDLTQPLDAAAIATLNPREEAVYNRNRVVAFATERGITGLNTDYMPEESPIRAMPRAEMRNDLIDYYTILADNRPGVFRQIYRDQTGDNAPRYRRGDSEEAVASRRAAATSFVDQLEYTRTYPENGFSYQFLDHQWSTRANGFNTVERFEYLPRTEPTSRDAVGVALGAVFSDPANVELVLRNAGNYTPIASAIAQRDNMSIQLPATFDGRGIRFDRSGALADVAARGYRPDLIGTALTREETNGILRNLPAMQADIAASADNREIVALRQQDFLALNDHRGISEHFQPGAMGMQMLYALATEPGNRTLLQLEENMRANSPTPEVADERIEQLRQGVRWATENITRSTLSMTHTDIARYVEAQEISSVAAGGRVDLAGGTAASTTLTSEQNTDFTGVLSTQPAAAAALLRSAGSNEGVASQVLSAAAGLPAAQQLVVARAALGDGQAANAIIASSSLPEDVKTRFATVAGAAANLTEADAGFVLTTLSGSPMTARAALTNIAANSQATAAVNTLLAADPALTTAVAAAVPVDQRAAIATEGRFNPDQWPAPVAPTPPSRATPRVLGTSMDRFVNAAAIADARGRAEGIARAFFETPETARTALTALQETNPQYTTALIVQAISEDPALRRQVISNLDRAGDRSATGAFAFLSRWTDNHEAGRLSGVVRELAEAYETGNQREITRRSAQLSEILTADGTTNRGQYRQMAVNQLYESIIAAPGGPEAVQRVAVATLNNTSLTASVGADANIGANVGAGNNPNVGNTPLRTSTYNPDQTLVAFYNAATQVDVGGGRVANDFVNSVSTSPVAGGINFTIVPIPRFNREGDQDLIEGDVGGCGGVGRPPCPPPIRPTTPPTTPPPPPTAPPGRG